MLHFKGRVSTYTRQLVAAQYANVTYRSPFISHVLLKHLIPGTKYHYVVGNGSMWSREMTFITLPLHRPKRRRWGGPHRQDPTSSVYPLRIGVLGDVGQTFNSTATLRHLAANRPQIIINVGDISYAGET